MVFQQKLSTFSSSHVNFDVILICLSFKPKQYKKVLARFFQFLNYQHEYLCTGIKKKWSSKHEKRFKSRGRVSTNIHTNTDNLYTEKYFSRFLQWHLFRIPPPYGFPFSSWITFLFKTGTYFYSFEIDEIYWIGKYLESDVYNSLRRVLDGNAMSPCAVGTRSFLI